MPILAKPSGGLQIGKALFGAPKLRKVDAKASVRVLFLSDLHMRRAHAESADNTLSACEGLEPDIIALGGDMSEYDEGLKLFLEKLKKRFPQTPIFAVPGNNDDRILEGDREAQKRLYASFGAEYLLNEARALEINGKYVCVAGLEDAYTHEPSFKGLFDGAEDSYKILIAHEPRRECLAAKPDLLLCGHTHGGQINVLGVTCYLLIGYEKRFSYFSLAGTSCKNNTTAIVSRGIGYSKFPIRFGSRSEIHYIY